MAKKAKTESVESEELSLVRSVTTDLQNFVVNLAAFARNVTALEERASNLSEQAKRLPEKISEKSDEKAQDLVRVARIGKREIPDTWIILKKIQGLVKAMIAKRKIAEEAFEFAIKTGEAHHFTWVDAEKRRIAKEAEAERVAAEERARKARDQELAELERQAVAAEEASDGLSEREQLFVGIMADGGSPEMAARNAGYKGHKEQAKRLMLLSKITSAIEAKLEARRLRREADAVQYAPLDVEVPDAEEEDLREGRRTRSAEVLDEAALIDAVIAGKHGIPKDVLMANPVALNEQARSLGKLIDRWPGVRLKTKRSLV